MTRNKLQCLAAELPVFSLLIYRACRKYLLIFIKYRMQLPKR